MTKFRPLNKKKEKDDKNEKFNSAYGFISVNHDERIF